MNTGIYHGVPHHSTSHRICTGVQSKKDILSDVGVDLGLLQVCG